MSLLSGEKLSISLAVVALLFAAVLSMPVALGSPSIWTDKADYAPSEPVVISGSGFVAEACVLLEIVWPTDGKTLLVVWTDDQGGFSVVWSNEKVEGTYTVNAYYCGSSTVVATTTFTDAGQGQQSIQYTLEGLTLSPSVTMTTGNVKGWNEDDWIPFRLTISGGPGTNVGAAIALEYKNSGKYGIDGFASCFGTTYPPKPCGSGSIPSSGSLWEVLVEGSPVSIPAGSISFETIAGATYIVFTVPGQLTIPSDRTLEITFAVHLARGGSSNLIASIKSGEPPTIPSGSGASSYPGASLDVRGGQPPTGDRTVSIQQVGPAGPALSASKSVDSVSWTRTITYDWTVEKSVSPSSLSLELGEDDTVYYTITATRTVASTVDTVTISGSICVTNTGGTATQNLAITDKVMYGSTVLASTTVDVSGNPVLDPGESHCYPYTLSFTPVDGVTTYTNVAEVTITNGPGATATKSFNLPSTPTVNEIDESASISDVQNCPSELSCETDQSWPVELSGSGTIEFDKTITNDELCLDTVSVTNTVTLTETDSGQTRTDDASVSVEGLCAILEVRKTVEDVDWERRTLYDWSVSKEVYPTSITASISTPVSVTYTITATRWVASIEDVVTISGQICVKNVGNTPTKDLEVTDTVLHDSTTVAGPVNVDISENDVLDPSEEDCYDYEVSFTPLTMDSTIITDYINKAEATVSNGYGDSAEEQFSLPSEPTTLTEVDASAELTDEQVCPENFECTPIGMPAWPITITPDMLNEYGQYVVMFEKTVHNLRVCETPDNHESDYSLTNTVTLAESDTEEERTDTAEVKIDVGPCPTRTQGFWATHPGFTTYVWMTYVPSSIKSDVCGKNVDDIGKVMGGFWSDISRKSTGVRRSLLDQARMQLVQQLLAAILNRYLLSYDGLVVLGDPSWIDSMISAANAACKGNDRGQIIYYVGVLDAFNKSGDMIALPSDIMVGPANPQDARSIANKSFWDDFP